APRRERGGSSSWRLLLHALERRVGRRRGAGPARALEWIDRRVEDLVAHLVVGGERLELAHHRDEDVVARRDALVREEVARRQERLQRDLLLEERLVDLRLIRVLIDLAGQERLLDCDELDAGSPIDLQDPLAQLVAGVRQLPLAVGALAVASRVDRLARGG